MRSKRSWLFAAVMLAASPVAVPSALAAAALSPIRIDDCQGEAFFFSAPPPSGEPDLILLGAFYSRAPLSNPIDPALRRLDTITIEVTRRRPHIVAFGAWLSGAVRFRIEPDGGTIAILVATTNQAEVAGVPPGVRLIVSRALDEAVRAGNQFPFPLAPGAELLEMGSHGEAFGGTPRWPPVQEGEVAYVGEVEALFGRRVTHFAGCERVAGFVVEDDK